MIEPTAGAILISDPFLKDPNFMRTVVFLCEHNAEGSFGFVLNRPFDQTLDHFLPDLSGQTIPVFYGGPVQTDTLHFLHRLPEFITGGQEVADGIFWGGDFNSVISLIMKGRMNPADIRLFLGYSGWSSGQLNEELGSKSWLTIMGKANLVFNTDSQKIWPDAIREMDDKYHPIINYPIDPQLN